MNKATRKCKKIFICLLTLLLTITTVNLSNDLVSANDLLNTDVEYTINKVYDEKTNTVSIEVSAYALKDNIKIDSITFNDELQQTDIGYFVVDENKEYTGSINYTVTSDVTEDLEPNLSGKDQNQESEAKTNIGKIAKNETLVFFVMVDQIGEESENFATSPPTVAPSISPTITPTLTPSVTPSVTPTISPTITPTDNPNDGKDIDGSGSKDKPVVTTKPTYRPTTIPEPSETIDKDFNIIIITTVI